MRCLVYTQSEYRGNDDILTIKPIGDLHIGHVNYIEKLAQEHINMLDYNVRGLLTGDLLECGTKTSIGKGVFDTNMTPKRQKEYLLELLRPKAQFIDGCVIGNHEERITEMSSIDIIEDVCRELKIPYHHYRGLIKYAWNGVCYTFEIWHGSGKGVSVASAMQQCEAMANKMLADVYCMGHVHKVADSDRIIYIPDVRNNKLIRVKQRFVLTGSALGIDNSYPDMKDLQERDVGFPTITLKGAKGAKEVKILT